MLHLSKRNMTWYEFDQMDEIDSPALIIYKDRVVENIRMLKSTIDSVDRLRPHVKTHKMKEVAELSIEEGIKKFKCATIAEAELLAISGAKDILIAYQLVGPKLTRFINLIKKYPVCRFSSLIDNYSSYAQLRKQAQQKNGKLEVYIDVNVGMSRTGIKPAKAKDLFLKCSQDGTIPVAGFHVYDGHIIEKEFSKREEICNQAFVPIDKLIQELGELGFDPTVVAGGSITFPIHKKRENIDCSPGTFVFWDKGYQEICTEQPFLPAALILTRVISNPQPNVYCLDLGYKAIASENPLNRRVHLLNREDATIKAQSEEHLVIEVDPLAKPLGVGEALFALPYHICPSVALYDSASIIKDKRVIDNWDILARKRKLSL